MDNNENINIGNIKIGSAVFHSHFGECQVKNIGTDLITVYCKSRKREMQFLYPEAFFNGHLSTKQVIDCDKAKEKSKESSIENNIEVTLSKSPKLTAAEIKAKRSYKYCGDNLVGKIVIYRNKSVGIISEYIDRGQSKEGLIKVNFDGTIKSFLYPSSFIQKFLSFKDETDFETISSDIEIYRRNSKDEIEKEKNSLNSLKEHLSIVDKYKSVEDFCKHYKSAINKEISCMKNQGNKTYRLTNGTEVSNIGSSFVYSFESEGELSLLPDFAINIYLGNGDTVKGTIISCEENSVMFLSSKLSIKNLKEILISFDAWFIMENLKKRLDELSCEHNFIVEKLCCKNSKITAASELKYGQKSAVEMACTNPVTFIWGPPGTGKTSHLQI